MAETEAMDKALVLPEIIENILSFVSDDEDFLNCCLINNDWDAEVLRAFPKRNKGLHRTGPHLNVQTYMEQKYRKKGAHLPKGSRLGTRVFVGGAPLGDGDDDEDCEERDPKDFLLFFRSGEGEQTEALFLDDHSIYTGYEGLTWGGALHEVLRNNLAPKLRELTLDYMPEGRIDDGFENGDTDFKGLQSLRVLDIRCCYEFEEIVKGSFTTFIKALLREAWKLEKLVIRRTLFPLETNTLQNLKVLELRLMTVQSSLVPELERVLSEVSKNCKSLETLSLPFLVEEGFEGVIKFPRFPRLKVFTCRDLRRLPLDGDLTRFLREKMPQLRSLFANSDFWHEPVETEVFWRALHSSRGTHQGLQSLSIPAPNDPNLLKGLQTKLPSLKRLDLNGLFRTEEMEEENPDVFWLTELALALANCKSLYASISFSHFKDGRKVRRKFKAKVGPEWKGTFQLYKSAVFSDGSEIRLVPENK